MPFKSMVAILLGLILTLASCQEKAKKKGSSVTFNIGGEPSTLNPMSATDAYSRTVREYINESLLSRDPDTYEWKPGLATEWTISEDKRVFDFKLRPGVKWHDGKEFTAEDVKFSYEVIFTDDWKALGLRPYFEAIKSVEVIDKLHVRFTVKDDYYQNFEVCAGLLEILPKHFYQNPENKKEFARKLIGTGPYLFTKYDKGQKIILVKNPDWWGNTVEAEKGTYNFPKMVMRFVQEDNVELELLKKGDIDYASFTPESFVKKTVGKVWEERVVKVKTENKAPKGYNFIAWNMKNPILKDKEVRKALSMLFNRPMMVEKFEYNLSTPATGPIYIQSDYANQNVKAVEYNPTEALAILNRAGWKDTDKDGVLDKVIGGKKTKFSLTIIDPIQELMKYLTVYKEDASRIGVELNLKNVEWNSFIKLLEEKNFEGVRLAWSGGMVDWDPKQIWHSASAKGTGSNFISYSNPEVDRLIDEARQIYEKEKRIPVLQKVHELIANDYPYVFFFNLKYALYGHSKRIEKPKDTFQYDIGKVYWMLK